MDVYLYKTLMSKKEKLFAAAHEELENSRKKMIDRYAKRKKTKETEFKVGSKVQYRNLSLKKFEKKKKGSRFFPQKGFLVVKKYDTEKGILHLRRPDAKKTVKKVSEKAAILWTGDNE